MEVGQIGVSPPYQNTGIRPRNPFFLLPRAGISCCRQMTSDALFTVASLNSPTTAALNEIRKIVFVTRMGYMMIDTQH